MTAPLTRPARPVRSRRAGRRTARLVAASAALAALLTGCVAIPTSGPIGDGEVVVDAPGVAVQLPSDPVVDASPGEIIRGFLLAGSAGLADDFTVARKFLTVGASDSWNPRGRVLLYPEDSGGPSIEESEDGSVVVTVPVEGSVDASGRYAEASPEALPEQLVFRLARDGAGQWRITELDDGVLMNGSSFERVYRRVPLYFATPDRRQLVPDVRWFATSETPTLAVRALLAGPSPWLRDAVVSGAPEGAELNTDGVPVTDDGVARIDLAETPTLPEQPDRDLLQAQLLATLRPAGVTGVQVSVGGIPWNESAVPVLDRDVAPESGPYVLQGDVLAVVREGTLEPVADAPSLAGLDPHDPALSLDETVRVVLSGPGRLLLLPRDGSPPRLLLSGGALVPPSVDRLGWTWTGERTSTGVLVAVAASGEVVRLEAPWLQGRTVRSLRVSRDGARVAVLSVGTAPDDVVVDVAAVVRDEEGRPAVVSGEPTTVGAALTDAVELAWVDELTLAVLGTSGDLGVLTTHVVPVGGPTRALTLMEGTGIAAGRGERTIHLVDAAGVLLQRSGNQWTAVAEGVRDPVFPG